MSFDLTVGARDAAAGSTDGRVDPAAPPARILDWLAAAIVSAATGVGIAVSAAVGLALFLR